MLGALAIGFLIGASSNSLPDAVGEVQVPTNGAKEFVVSKSFGALRIVVVHNPYIDRPRYAFAEAGDWAEWESQGRPYEGMMFKED